MQGAYGAKATPSYLKDIEATVQSVDDKLIVELYGERTTNMLSLNTLDTIQDGQGVSLDSLTIPSHKVISVKKYRFCSTALVEKI